MDFEFKIYLKRALNEFNLSRIIYKLSDEPEIQMHVFNLKEDSYYSAVISHSYYCIFYSAKAYLIAKGIKTKAPEEHKKTFIEFENFVKKGVIDVELLRIYKKMIAKADTLLHIFKIEKKKRGKFTYHRLPQANREPAKESLENARYFYSSIEELCNV